MRLFTPACVLLASAVFASQSEDGAVGLARVQSAQLPEDLTLGIGVYNRLVNTSDFVSAFNHTLGDNRAVDRGQATPADLYSSDHTLGLSLSGGRWYEISAALPFYYQDLTLSDREISGVFLGDLRLNLQASKAFGEGNKPWAVALQLGGTLPTSKPATGPVARRLEETPAKTSVYDDGSRAGGTSRGDLRTGLALTYDFTKAVTPKPFSLTGNAFVRTTSPFVKSNHDFYDIFGFSGLAEWHALSCLTLFGQLVHEGRIESNLPDDADLNTWGLGLEGKLPYHLSVVTGIDWGFNNDGTAPARYAKKDGSLPVDFAVKGAPDAQLYLALTWQGKVGNLDPDKDGIAGTKDKCPLEAEDKDGFEDEDGCPDADNDKDGIADLQDKCPVQAEDKDGFEDEDGCPDLDNDKDSLADAQDKCPDQAEDKDGFEDMDGCPDLDNDKDGVADAQDKCPLAPQGVNGTEGCPMQDGDNDGIADAKDKCLQEKEILNGYQDEDGCPDKAPIEEKTLILTGVNFETAKAILKPESFPVLDDLAKQLQLNTAIFLEVSGHTDNSGNASKNLALSQARAQTVADYLITKGVAKERLTVKGYGSTKPIADNKTAEGKAQNRRVEFNRLK